MRADGGQQGVRSLGADHRVLGLRDVFVKMKMPANEDGHQTVNVDLSGTLVPYDCVIH
jgi:hypothetical protein